MVGLDLLQDLKSYGLPIIAIGDQGQLQPVLSESNGLLQKPDYSLTEIHRQAKESIGIRLSMMARNNEVIKPGLYDNEVLITDSLYRDDEDFLTNDQILCWKNVTRHVLNNIVREELNFNHNFLNEKEKNNLLKK